MVLSMLVACVSMLNELLAPFPRRDTSTLCKFAAGWDPGGRLVDWLRVSPMNKEALRECVSAGPAYPYWRGLVGTAVVLLAAAALYFWLPRWKSRRRRMITPDEADPTGHLRAELMRLVRVAGLRTVPHFVVDPASFGVGAVTFGHARRRTVCLYAGLHSSRHTDPAGFEAVVLHELAHVRNRDVDLAHAVTALWRVFVLLVAVPFTILYGVTFVAAEFGAFAGVDDVFWPAARPAMVQAMTGAVFLVLLVVLARADVLRHRELYADADAVALGADRGTWDAAVDVHRSGRYRGFVAALVSSHPTWAERRRSLDDPAALFSLGALQMFLVGTATLLSGHTLNEFVDSTVAVWAAALPTSAIVALATWRSVAHNAHQDARDRGSEREDEDEGAPVRGRGALGVRAGLALGLGLGFGELLSGAASGARWIPEHPEALLVLLLGATAYVVWLVQCAWLRPRFRRWGGTGRKVVTGAGMLAALLVGVAGINWWLRSGYMYLSGDFLAAGGVRRTITEVFPGQWGDHAAELTWIVRVLSHLAIDGNSTVFVAAAAVLWAYPLVLLLGGSAADRRKGRSAAVAGLLGGALCGGGVALVMASLHTGRPPIGERGGGFTLLFVWWMTVAIWAGVATTSVVVAAVSRRLWLVRALVAAGVAQAVALAGQFLLASTDGCLGPTRTMGDSCIWLPSAAWPLNQVLAGPVMPAMYGGALAAVLVGAAAQALRRKAVPLLSVSPLHEPPLHEPSPAVRAQFPPPPPRRSLAVRPRALRLTGVLLLAAAVVAGPATALGLDSGRTGSVVSITAGSPPESRMQKVQAFQLLAWYQLGGRTDILELTSGYVRFEKEFRKLERAAKEKPGATVTLDAQAFRSLCTALDTAATKALGHLHIPDAELDTPWWAALKQSRKASRTCLESLDRPPGDPDAGTDMLGELVTGYVRWGKAAAPVLTRIEGSERYWPNLVHIKGK
jgi:Zn-dependent protease with chaperone function